ncbi:MAG TPA: antibiotic biosynthesis monooxygenase family protein [Actinomycetes bacterium]|jgi:heme-degrading monooxygenase HmoA|nr:antibiotic biosynthesis monooxygenase family protein [Actinomycetes bacterium]
MLDPSGDPDPEEQPMTEFVTTATWRAKPGEEEAFATAWAEFTVWASGWPGARTLRLGRDTADPSRFVSFGLWADADSAHAWKSSPEFAPRMALVQAHVDAFHPGELDLVAGATDGAADVEEAAPA